MTSQTLTTNLFNTVRDSVSEMVSIGSTFDEAMRDRGVLLSSLPDADLRYAQNLLADLYKRRTAPSPLRHRKPGEMF